MTESGWESLPLLDRAVTAEFALPAETLAEFFAKYFEQAGRRLTELSGAITRGDAATAALEAHTLSGSSGTLGIARVAQLAGELEAAAESGDLASATRWLGRLRLGVLETQAAYGPT